jgi:hypothetical protein
MPSLPHTARYQWLLKVPGTGAYRGRIKFPRNCIPLVGQQHSSLRGLLAWDACRFDESYPKSYQLDYARWAVAQNGVLAHAPAGSGKTLMMALAGVTKMRETGKSLVIITTAGAKWQWRRELKRLFKLDDVSVLAGKTATQLSQGVYVINWHVIPYWRMQLARLSPIIIMDETDLVKSWKRYTRTQDRTGKTVRKVAYDRIVGAAELLSRTASWRIGGTATLAPYEAMDAWGQLDLLQPKEWGSSYEFAMRYANGKPGEYGGLDTSGKSCQDELLARMSTMRLRVTQAQANKEMGATQRDLVFLPPAEQNRPGAFSKLLKASRTRTSSLHIRLMQAASMKRKWIVSSVVDDIRQGHNKIVVFTGRRAEVHNLANAIKKKVGDISVLSGDGDTPSKQRMVMASSFVKDEPLILVATYEAFGRALDGMQHAHRAYFGMLPFTPGMIEQSEGRFSRLGSMHPTRITYVIAEGTVDERVTELLLMHLDSVSDIADNPQLHELQRQLEGADRADEIIANLIGDL